MLCHVCMDRNGSLFLGTTFGWEPLQFAGCPMYRGTPVNAFERNMPAKSFAADFVDYYTCKENELLALVELS